MSNHRWNYSKRFKDKVHFNDDGTSYRSYSNGGANDNGIALAGYFLLPILFVIIGSLLHIAYGGLWYLMGWNDKVCDHIPRTQTEIVVPVWKSGRVHGYYCEFRDKKTNKFLRQTRFFVH